MNANIWIKTLNTRLLAEPNWALKAGYLVLLIAASLALAAFLILTKVFAFVLWFVPAFAKAMIEIALTSHRRRNIDGWHYGTDGYGEYRNGVLHTMVDDDDN